ncbi:hypothetical protein V6N11_078896 [Hibiscus sabdariffa]|uniref:Uncharacterized protein n=1 Tax=Hibiscus sabdariffa TaxID=183260 RepID=A0ABR2RU11_9ROSI
MMTDVEKGDETVFPNVEGNFSTVWWWNELSECGKKGLVVKPKTGDALPFRSMTPNATLDHSSLHGGCLVIKGDKCPTFVVSVILDSASLSGVKRKFDCEL